MRVDEGGRASGIEPLCYFGNPLAPLISGLLWGSIQPPCPSLQHTKRTQNVPIDATMS